MTHGATNTRYLKEYRANLHLTNIQKEILIGTLLGDGHIESSRSGMLARFKIRHTVLFSEYVDWHYRFWKRWTLKGPTFDPYNNSIILRTIYHPELSEWKRLFYTRNRKIIPSDIHKLLVSARSLAVWFMDDGNGTKQGEWLRISTYAFGLSGNQILQDCLDRNFGLKATIYHDSKGNYLWFSKSNAKKLFLLMRSHILPCMKYKFQSLLLHC
ncbi:hypothetical protein HYW55_00095 [Candidatus Gottesmanbacteria bacterium]|nr:hypothetical protein [Candidatus Gottesmanbacteria bacterium]